ncbi:L,D-transpeptidase family protein [Actinoplanes subtropicus]|uniref:L,D-transpeptidase family protein n=1 Tax=Actinoplanes subtropicus TaxID=543632 RepID=UPI000B1418ED|nr:L,D-transpeptidase family protein [Actinoplanes subtropicus]
MGIVSATMAIVLTLSGPPRDPAWFPTRLAHLGDARQAIVVTGRSTGSSYATLRAFVRGDDGRWRAAFPAMAARTGYGGWQWAAKRVQDTGTTPIGTFRITEAFGLAANPGAKLPYRRVDGDDYWVGDRTDPRTYNLFQPMAAPQRTWRIGQAERLAAYPRQYRYVAVIDFNRPPPATVSWDPKKHEYFTTDPAMIGRGSAIFLHVNGKGSTAGCVSITQASMISMLRWLDPHLKPRIVMAPTTEIDRA